ncbi:phospholipid/cholesterol/gamma-HCH transport system permease protein [Hoeflea marina]|uniref:Phospholipid/cholesterol/gamma-HCH transport system permease protein n=1 Tax=Hoeflea marina TaxID=274592 RepID=A0A317PSI6_9HYPH|nr:MlaE family lipid ABC transporter permease subunit [Hoeflea marina]PWW04438.1 phospholipid/cholesterol/gamma-HCH transport system permease protein [Hoeflea marina]
MRREKSDGGEVLHFSGDWRHAAIAGVYGDVVAAETSLSGKQLRIDLSRVSHFDTAGGWLVKRLQTAAADKGIAVEIAAPDSMASLIDAIPAMTETEAPAPRERMALFDRTFDPIGRLAYDLWDDLVAAMYILGSAVRGTQLKFNRSAGISPAAIVSQLDHMGVRAVPIIILMSFLIGAIIAQQGAFQLRYFGAEVFVVDLVGILQLREIGVLLTAIMIAGRSGSAITAEIGSMKMREEVDALKVMGLNPVGVLVFPRLVALTIALPLLTIIANFSALAGAAAVSWAYSGITLDVFATRLREAIDISTVISGMIKAPFMALAIGIVAAVEGMKVGGSAESLGRRVTASVVKAIFVVILMDGLFAIFYAAIDF